MGRSLSTESDIRASALGSWVDFFFFIGLFLEFCLQFIDFSFEVLFLFFSLSRPQPPVAAELMMMLVSGLIAEMIGL